jgi:hypothetical protein
METAVGINELYFAGMYRGFNGYCPGGVHPFSTEICASRLALGPAGPSLSAYSALYDGMLCPAEAGLFYMAHENVMSCSALHSTMIGPAQGNAWSTVECSVQHDPQHHPMLGPR